MRHFIFYILLAFLTFSIGSFAVYNLYSENTKISKIPKGKMPNQLLLENSPQTVPQFTQELEENKTSGKPFCKNKRILPVWKELIKEPDFQEQNDNFFESPNCKDMLEIKEIDLNRDGQKEILLRGKNFNLCSAVGNCRFWIYAKNGKRFKKLLYSNDYMDITDLPDQVRKTRTNNYSDIVLKGHLNASETSYEYYNFDGREYKQKKCLVEACITSCASNKPKWGFISCEEYDSKKKY